MTKRRPRDTAAKATGMKIEKRLKPFLSAVDELLSDTIWQCFEEKVSDPEYHLVAKDVTDKLRRVRELRARL